MKKINTKKVKELLIQKNIKQIVLANFLELSASSLSDSLKEKRPLSMNYIFDLAVFFSVDAKSLTLKNDTANQQCKASTEIKEKVS